MLLVGLGDRAGIWAGLGPVRARFGPDKMRIDPKNFWARSARNFFGSDYLGIGYLISEK